MVLYRAEAEFSFLGGKMRGKLNATCSGRGGKTFLGI